LRVHSLTVILTLNEVKEKNLTAQGRLRRGNPTPCHCEPKAWQYRKAKLKNQRAKWQSKNEKAGRI